MFGLSGSAAAGGLIQYSADLSAVFQRSAYYIDRILRGAKPGDLPVEHPTHFELVVNMKTAKALGVTMPRSILLRANHLIDEEDSVSAHVQHR